MCHVLPVECADQCKVCDTAGVGKCDPGHCNTKFTFVAKTQTCERKSQVLCITFLYMGKNTVLVHQYKNSCLSHITYGSFSISSLSVFNNNKKVINYMQCVVCTIILGNNRQLLSHYSKPKTQVEDKSDDGNRHTSICQQHSDREC